jgi:hypothetical protein
MAATVRLSQFWEDLYRHCPFFSLFYRRHPDKKTETAPRGCPAVVGEFPCLVGVPHRSGHWTIYDTAHLTGTDVYNVSYYKV